MMQTNDGDLLAAIARGELDGLGLLVERHHEAIHRYVARRIGAADAEDVVSETFETAVRKAGAYRALRPDARPWLFGIATNLLARRARAEVAMYRAYAKTGIDPAVASAEEQARPDTGQGRLLAGALAEMRSEHRDAFLLHALGELTYTEIAEELDVPVGTVKGWISRARAVAVKHLEANS